MTRLLSIAMWAKEAGCSREAVYARITKGSMKAVKIEQTGNVLMIDSEIYPPNKFKRKRGRVPAGEVIID